MNPVSRVVVKCRKLHGPVVTPAKLGGPWSKWQMHAKQQIPQLALEGVLPTPGGAVCRPVVRGPGPVTSNQRTPSKQLVPT